MNRNKQRNTQEHYFDPTCLRELSTFVFAGRQEGRRIAKGETRMKRNGNTRQYIWKKIREREALELHRDTQESK